jgi:hypothetical protein
VIFVPTPKIPRFLDILFLTDGRSARVFFGFFRFYGFFRMFYVSDRFAVYSVFFTVSTIFQVLSVV